MTRPSRSPSSDAGPPIAPPAAEPATLDVVPCGPVALAVSAATPALRRRGLEELEQFTADWPAGDPPLRVHLQPASAPATLVAGSFLRCSAMHVDQTAAGLFATCRSGAAGVFDAAQRRWDLRIVNTPRAPGSEDHVEDLLELVLTTAWRAAGWIPLHAGSVVGERRCALLVAPAKGGKSTLTTALVQRGWRTLGDDKALLAVDADGAPEVRGLTRQFNLDPRTRDWFPEVGDLERLPRLSPWNAKRSVSIDAVWRDCFASRAVPTHLVAIQRGRGPTRVAPLGARQVLTALLRQTVVPGDAATAQQILATLSAATRRLRGVRLELGDDAYADPANLDALDEALR
ncbi:MAG: hypothetical protein SF182_23740 [Deltaproteobacteria bacterium]|nr:hypothetical protein [Deltaproteobacteria bacterium]